MKNKLRSLRRKKGYTQTEFAKKIGISRTHLSNIEHGKAEPSGNIILKIGNALGVKVEKIFFNNSVVLKQQNCYQEIGSEEKWNELEP